MIRIVKLVAVVLVFFPLCLYGAEVKIENLAELDLTAAQAIAISDNPSLAAARTRVIQAKDRLEQARSLYYPSLDLSAAMGQTRLSDNSLILQQSSSEADQTRESYILGLSASWIVFDGFARKFTNLMAEQSADGSLEATRDGQRLLLQSVAEAYYGAQLADYNIAIAHADEGFNQRQLEDARVSYDQGAVSLSTVLNFEVQVNLAKSNILLAERDYQLARNGLAILMGMKNAQLPSDLELSKLTMIEKEDYSEPQMDDLLNLALNKRPDVKLLQKMEQRTKANIERLKSGYYPTVAVQGSIDGARSEDYALEEGDFGSTIGLSLSYNLFRGFEDEAKIAEATSSHRESVYDIQQLLDNVHFEVREAVANLLLAQKQLVLQRETTDLVSKTRDLVEVGYSAGQESLVRLNEAQRDLVKSQSNLALALVGLYTFRHNLDTVTAVTLPELEP